jgi:hypothetical protein
VRWSLPERLGSDVAAVVLEVVVEDDVADELAVDDELVVDEEVVDDAELVVDEEVVVDDEVVLEDELDDELEVEVDDELLVVELEPLVVVELLVVDVDEVLAVGTHDSRWATIVPEIGRFRLEIGVSGVVSTLNVYTCPPATVTVIEHASADACGVTTAAMVPSAAPRIPKKRNSFALACNSQSFPIRDQTVRGSPLLSVIRLCATPRHRVTAFARK